MSPPSKRTSDEPQPPPREPRRRDPLRRERILVAAAQLFAARGYDRTGLNDIGAAAGVTGPAVYRHFANKEELLVALFDRLISRLQRDTATILQADLSAEERLEQLVGVAVHTGVSERDILGLTPRDLQTLSPEARERIGGEQAKLRSSWSGLLRAARPELSETDARAMMGVTPALVTAVAATPGLSERRLETILTSMLMAALLADLDGAPASG